MDAFIIGEAMSSELISRMRARFSLKLQQGESVRLKEMIRQMVRELERNVILEALQANGWNRKRAARNLQISYRTLLCKIRQAALASDFPVCDTSRSDGLCA